LSGAELHQKGPDPETEFTRRVDIRNGRSVVDDILEMRGLMANERLASGTSSKVVLNNAKMQMDSLMWQKNHDILAESLNKLVYRQDGIQMTSLYQCPSDALTPKPLAAEKNYCPMQQTLASYKLRNQIAAVVYNPSIFPQDVIRIEF
jgi:hypothetical protein